MPFSCDRQVFLADTDSAGVIYFATLLRLCHEVYEISLAEFGIDLKHLFQSQALAIPITHAEVDFLLAIHAGERVTFCLTGERLTTSAFQLNYRVFKSNDRLSAQAQTKHICICPQSRQKLPLPDQIDRWLLTVLFPEGSC